jgi:hypothetical protein
MLPQLTRKLRLVLVLATAGVYLGTHVQVAAAKGKKAHKDDGEGGDEEGDDDEGDEGDGGKGDDDEGGEDAAEDAKEQPPVTAGGLYTIKSYPVRENERPLTITQGVTQARLSLGTDLSAKGAFNSLGVSLEGVYGLKDNFMLMGGVTSAYNFNQFSVYFGFEGALAYDLLDIRLAANLHRFAVPRFCGTDPMMPANCNGMADAALPDGNYDAAPIQFSVDLGFPFRYAIKPQIAIVALQTLVTFDFNAAQVGTPSNRGTLADGTKKPFYCNGTVQDTMGNNVNADPANCMVNDIKPDLNPSLGIALNPVPPLSVVVFAQLRIPDFDTSAGNFQVPVTLRAEFSPTRKLDFGLEFTLINVKPAPPQGAIDNRFLSLFGQARF